MSFTALAEQILVEAKKIDEHEAAGREISSLATTAGAPNPDNFSVEFKNSRETLINTAGQLLRQSLSPRDFIREKMCTVSGKSAENGRVVDADVCCIGHRYSQPSGHLPL